MKQSLKIILTVIIIAAVVLSSSAAYVLLLDTDENEGSDTTDSTDDTSDTTDDTDDTTDDTDDTDDDTDDEVDDETDNSDSEDDTDTEDDETGEEYGYAHTVFIEEATAGWCSNCPDVAKILYELYTSGDYRFYYVSLVHDENEHAAQRLDEDYNLYGFPSVFIDGGYKVILGQQDTSDYEEKLSNALSRDIPELHLEVAASWDESSDEIDTSVSIYNNENQAYTGRLKVYLTEKTSSWYDYDGKPYRFSFLEFIINKPREIS